MPPDAPSLASSVLESWTDHVRQARSTSEGPSVRELLALAGEQGERPEPALLRAVATECGTPEVQQAWAEWTAVTDREELRLRLAVLRHLDALDPSLHSFVLFFFRASDPTLYQAAARTLGAHLSASAELQSFLRTYAEERSVDLYSPVRLIGKRSHRRLLIALAAHRATGGDVPVLRMTEPDSYLEASALDLNAVLVATRIVVEDAPGQTAMDDREALEADWKAFALALLEAGADAPMMSTADPSLLRSWGALLAVLGDAAPERVETAWKTLAERVLDGATEAPEESFSRRLQRLNRADELVHSAVWLPGVLQEALSAWLREHPDERLGRFLRYRGALWAEREGASFPEAPSALIPNDETTDESVLHTLIQAECGAEAKLSVLEDGSRSARRLSAFVELLRAMGERARWLQRPVAQRAFIAFAALDHSRHLSLPAPAVDATLDQFAFPSLRGESASPSPDRPRGGRAGSTTFRILLRLSNWEGAGTERFVGTHLLHQISNSYVLMMLLPSGRASELTASLADAIEHQCRLQLRARDDFHPAWFLYETSIRDPHPQFYEHLYRLCEGRTYPDAQGQEVDLAPIVDRLRDEVRTVRDQSGRLSAQLTDAPWPGDPAFAEGLRYVRRILTAVQQDTDLIDGLERVVDMCDPRSKDPATGTRRTFGVLGGPGAASGPLVHRGQTGDSPPTYPEVRRALQEHAVTLREALAPLQPDTLDAVHDIRDEALDIEDALKAVEAQLVPVIGVVEGTLLVETFRHLQNRLQSWTDVLTSLHAQWRGLKDGDCSPLEAARRLFEQVLAHEPGPLRQRLLRVLAQTLTTASDPATTDLDEGDRWGHAEQVLSWALASEQRTRLSSAEQEAWTDVFAAHWETLLEWVMAEGYESRVRRLTSFGRTEAPFLGTASPELLRQARTWFFDRYHFSAARRITDVFGSGSVVGRTAATAGAFFLHFSRVWLALLLGAILMLDFGDAWTAMAAEGDVVSVGITFVVGVVGTFGYLFADLQSKVRRAPEDRVWQRRRSRWGRLLGFLALCLVVTGGITATLWGLLAGTGAVVEGAGAALHLVVWTGFALFVGVFFGLIAETA